MTSLFIFSCGGSDKAKEAQTAKEIETLDSLTVELDQAKEDVEGKKEEMDAALDDLLNEFETEE